MTVAEGRNYIEGYTGIDMAKRAVALAAGWGWCEEHKDDFKHHSHPDPRPDEHCILELDGRGPSVHDDDFSWDEI